MQLTRALVHLLMIHRGILPPPNQNCDALARINHQLRRETPCSAGWSKAGAGLWKGCMRTYRPHRNPSPTPLQPASRKSQQMAGDFSGLDPRPTACIASASIRSIQMTPPRPWSGPTWDRRISFGILSGAAQKGETPATPHQVRAAAQEKLSQNYAEGVTQPQPGVVCDPG